MCFVYKEMLGVLDIRGAKDGFDNFLAHLSDVQSFGRYLETVSLYPVFLTVHCILVAIALRNHDGGMLCNFHVLSMYFTCTLIMISHYFNNLSRNSSLSHFHAHFNQVLLHESGIEAEGYVKHLFILTVKI